MESLKPSAGIDGAGTRVGPFAGPVPPDPPNRRAGGVIGARVGIGVVTGPAAEASGTAVVAAWAATRTSDGPCSSLVAADVAP